MADTDPLLAAVEPRIETFEQETPTIDRWIGILPDGTEYYSADTLDGLYEYERDHQQMIADTAKWLAETGHKPSRPAPPPFTEVVHRVIHTKTITTYTTAEVRRPREENR